MHIHEYIFAALAVIAILLASNLMLTMTTEPLKVASEREGLKRIAQSIMTQILLNPGDPVDWGSNTTIDENNLGSFGLAYQSRTVREAYVLDADKILRLKNDANPFYISPQKVSELLGLNTREYGFTIEILPQFNITVKEISGGCRVSVKSVDGINPIQYADVTAKMYYLSGGQIYEGLLVNNATGPDGACTIEFGDAPSGPAVVIFVVDYRGIRVPKVFVPSGSEESVQCALLVGRKLSLSVSVFSSVIYEVIAPIMDGECEIFKVSSGWGVDTDGSAYVKYVEPGTIVALAAAGSDLIVAQRFMDLVEYGTVSLRSPSLPLGFMLEKMVSVEGFSYIVRLYVWRLVW